LIEHLALDVRVCGSKLAHFSVLLGDQLLAHRCYLDVHVVLGEIEVRPEERRGFACVVPVDSERGRLVLPVDSVEVQKSREFPFAVVSEQGGLCR